MSKTVFISILSGVEAKNILRTNIVGRLLDAGLRVVLFVKSRDRIAYYEKEFHHPKLVYETVERYAFSPYNGIFETLKHFLVTTKSQKLYRWISYKDTRNILAYVAGSFVSGILSNAFVRTIVRFFDYHCSRDHIFDSFFERYRPDLVFLANLFDTAEISLLRSAKLRGVPTIGFVNSWDKITAKGFVRLLPDNLVVLNKLTEKEANEYMDMPRRKLFIAGVPQYDMYADRSGIVSREAFFNTIKADPAKPLVVFAPMGTGLSDTDWQAIDMMGEVARKLNVELLVRFQPNDFFDAEAEFKKRPNLRYDLPGTRFGSVRGVDWDMSIAEMHHLKNTLTYASVVVSYASSLAIDAACFDTPIINLNFEVGKNGSFLKTPTVRYVTEHYSKALKTGGIRLVGSREELEEWIQKYLHDRSLDRAGRKRLVEEQVYLFDGKAGERIATYIIEHART